VSETFTALSTNLTISLLLFFLSAIFRAVDQLICWRQPETTIFPDWFFSPGWWVIDVYHIAAGAKIWTMALAFYLFPLTLSITGWILAWFIYYQIFNLFFHVIFKRKGHRENFIFRFVVLVVAGLLNLLSRIFK